MEIIIRKQKFRIKASGEQQALEARRAINDQMQYKLLQMYDNTLSSLEKDTYADKIVINLGKMTLPELNALPERIKEELMKQLQWGGQLHEMASEGSFSSINRNSEVNNFSAGGMKQGQDKGISPAKQTDEVSVIIYFLEKGIYPWWYAGEQQKPAEMLQSFSPAQMEKWLLKIIGILKYATGNKPEIVKTRLRQQLTDVLFDKLILCCADLQSNSNIKQNIMLLSSEESVSALAGFFSISALQYQQMLTDYLLDVISEQKEAGIKEFLLILKENTKMIFANKPARRGFESSSGGPAGTAGGNLQSISPDIKSVLEKIASAENEKITEAIPDTVHGEISDKKLVPGQEPGSVFSEEEGVYISNAGLVILHPFISALFKELNLLDEKDQFTSGEHLKRAVVLLHYLQTGHAEYEEQHLAFNKIICGMKPEDNLPNDIILLQNEKTECDQLLDIVIGYWEALKGASREALRETFFIRKGKLGLKDDTCLLQVERNAADILIDRLPWGMGIIKFPWLSYLIHVEW